MDWIRRIVSWIVAGIVVVCVAVVFDGIGKGILDLSSDEALIFALAATVVATFLYKRHAASGGTTPRTEVISRAVIIGILVMLLTIPSKIRALPDVTSEVSSIQTGISSVQDELEELKDKVDSIETDLISR